MHTLCGSWRWRRDPCKGSGVLPWCGFATRAARPTRKTKYFGEAVVLSQNQAPVGALVWRLAAMTWRTSDLVEAATTSSEPGPGGGAGLAAGRDDMDD